MIELRRGVGSDSRKPQMPRLRSAPRSGRFSPRTASMTVESSGVQRRGDDDPQDGRLGDDRRS